MDLDKITIGALVVGVVSLDKIITWCYKKFNTAYKFKKDQEDFKKLVLDQQKSINENAIKTDLLIEGLKELLKGQLKQCHREYMDKKSITSDELDNFNHLYTVYSSLKGNGTGTKYHEDVLLLPIVE